LFILAAIEIGWVINPKKLVCRNLTGGIKYNTFGVKIQAFYGKKL